MEKSGAWFSYGTQRIGQGRENAKNFMRENSDIANELETAIRANAGLVQEQMMDASIANDEEADA